MVEGTALEMRRARKGTESSNLSLSAHYKIPPKGGDFVLRRGAKHLRASRERFEATEHVAIGDVSGRPRTRAFMEPRRGEQKSRNSGTNLSLSAHYKIPPKGGDFVMESQDKNPGA